MATRPTWPTWPPPPARIRWLVGFAIFGLVVSGVTAFPLLAELNLLASWLAPEGASPSDPGLGGLARWILLVREGLENTYREYPFIAYGTDWLAFAHLVIAAFFLPVWKDPVRYQGVLLVGLWACLGVIPLALICGPLRGIPFYWQLIDCSFGIICAPALWWAYRLARRLERETLLR